MKQHLNPIILHTHNFLFIQNDPYSFFAFLEDNSRKSCSVAPERFIASIDLYFNKAYAYLTPSTDIFSIGLVCCSKQYDMVMFYANPQYIKDVLFLNCSQKASISLHLHLFSPTKMLVMTHYRIFPKLKMNTQRCLFKQLFYKL